MDPARTPPPFAEWLEMVHEADRPALHQAARDGFRNGQGRYQLVFRIRRADDGVMRWFLSFGRVLEADAAGRPRRIVGVNLDVTAQREIQHDLQRTEALLRAIGECSADLIYAKDHEGRFLFANPPTLRVLGKPLDEVLGRADSEWHHDPAQAEAVMANDRRILATGQAEVLEEVYDAAGLGTRVFRSAKAPLRDARGVVIGVVGVSSDITDLKHAETALRSALEDRELLVREADHRIKNSLQLVASLLRIQAGRTEEPAAAAALHAAVARVLAISEAHRALYLGQDLRTVDLSRMLRDLVRLASGLAPGIALHCDLPDRLPLDAERPIPLGLLANELITNALRHAYPQGQPGAVRIAVRPEAGTLVVAVADDGVGLPGSGAPEGGLGTGLIQALSRQIGAAVETRSVPGAGTTITLRVPLRPALDPAEARQGAA
jgi:PAS domain S-box-containing protein